MKIKTLLFAMGMTGAAFAQGPSITSWVINTTNATGYNCSGCTPSAVNGSITADIQSVDYSPKDVWITTDGVPSYNVGPWTQNPNVPTEQNKVWKFTLSPSQNTGTLESTALGANGVWSNGVGIYNAKDGYFWDDTKSEMAVGGTGTWNRNAYVFEAVSFDACLGHADGSGTYHNHVNPKCLYDYTATTAHSPIIGYAFDGYPIYGAFGYTNTDGTGAIKRIASSYKLTTNSTRAAGPDMTVYAAGSFCEDYEYTVSYGDLDEFNGRTCITPEYPAGTYAYFVTTETNGDPAYPFVLGPNYYGVVTSGNTGPTGGTNTVPEVATNYVPVITDVIKETAPSDNIKIYPNPVIDNELKFEVADNSSKLVVEIIDYQGRTLIHRTFEGGTYANKLSISAPYLNTGVYWVAFTNGDNRTVQQVLFDDGF